MTPRPHEVRWFDETVPSPRDLIFRQAARYGDKIAVIDGDNRYSYADIARLALENANALIDDGIRPGSRVGILMENCVDWITAYFGILAAGSIVIPLNTWYTSRELSEVLNRAGASAIFVSGTPAYEFVERVMQIAPTSEENVRGDASIANPVPALRRVVVAGKPRERVPGTTRASEFRAPFAVSERSTLQELQRIWRRRRGDDIAQIMFTSGSTATPKAVKIVGRAAVRNALHAGQRHGLSESDALFLAAPLFFVFGLGNGLLGMLTHGGAVSLQGRFEPLAAMGIIQRDRCTTYLGMSAMNLGIIEHPKRGEFDLSSLRKGFLGTGGSDHHRLVATELGIRDFNRGYGMTEAHVMVSMTSFSTPVEERLANFGRPMPDVEVRIAEFETRRELPTGEEGEICIRGYNITPGYYRDPARSAALLDEDGFFHTGDIGRLLDDGALDYIGRASTMIKTNGLNVAPAEVEEVLLSHPLVREAYVTGVADPVHGEVVAAAFVANPGGENAVTPDELRSFARATLSKFKIPRRFVEVKAGDVPRTATGKVSLVELRQLLADNRE